MHIEYQCSGGYGGLRFSYQCETDTLPAADARKILDLVDAAGVFKLKPEQLIPKSRNIPDDFVCRLTLSTAEKKKTLSFNELGVSENLRRLSAHLRELSIRKNRRSKLS